MAGWDGVWERGVGGEFLYGWQYGMESCSPEMFYLFRNTGNWKSIPTLTSRLCRRGFHAAAGLCADCFHRRKEPPSVPFFLSLSLSLSLSIPPLLLFLFFHRVPSLYLHRRVTVFVKAPAEHRDNWRNYPGPCEQSFPNGVFQIQRWIKCPFILAKLAPGKYTQRAESGEGGKKAKGDPGRETEREREEKRVEWATRETRRRSDRRTAIRSSLSEVRFPFDISWTGSASS